MNAFGWFSLGVFVGFVAASIMVIIGILREDNWE